MMIAIRLVFLLLIFLVNLFASNAWDQVGPPSRGVSSKADGPAWLPRSATKVALATITAFALTMPVHAVDVDHGKALFQANCAGCHAGGQNLVSEKKTLQKEALEKYRGTTDPIKIQAFLQKGMPHKMLPLKFSEEDYADATAYVLDQALGGKW
jgi:cytochrome c6